MKAIKSKVTIISHNENKESELKFIEFNERVKDLSYKNINEKSYKSFLPNLMKGNDYSALDHILTSIHFTCDLKTSQQIRTHQNILFSQEKLNLENKEEFIVIAPLFCKKDTKFYHEQACNDWVAAISKVEELYFQLVKKGIPYSFVDTLLPLCLKTELIMTATLKNLREIIDIECSRKSNLNLLLLILPLLKNLFKDYPELFESLHNKYIKTENSQSDKAKSKPSWPGPEEDTPFSKFKDKESMNVYSPEKEVTKDYIKNIPNAEQLEEDSC